MNSITFLTIIFLLFASCTTNNIDNDKMPEAVQKIVSQSQKSPDYLNLVIEITNIESDSVLVSTYIVNSSNTNSDTLYHSSNFPLYVAYDNKRELTHPLEDQFFFDDLNTTIVKSDMKNFFHQNFRIKRQSSKPYKIIALFEYEQHAYNSDGENFWLVSEPVLVK